MEFADNEDNCDDEAVTVELSVAVVIDEIAPLELVEETKALLELLEATMLYTASRSVPPHASVGFPAHGVLHCAGSLGLTGMLSSGSPSPQKPCVGNVSVEILAREDRSPTYIHFRL